MTTTLEQILDLAAQARRSPHARRVLFDALIDRYGEDFLFTVDRAQTHADQRDRSQAIVIRPRRLPAADEAWQYLRASGDETYRLLENWFVFSTIDVDFRRHWWSASPLDDTVVVTVVHPRQRLAQRRRST